MIRMALPSDVPEMLAIYRPYVLDTTYTFEYTVPTQEEFTHRLESYTKQFPWLVWEEDGRVLGYAYATAPFTRAAYAWCAEISIYLSPAIHGRGIGRQLYAVVEQILWRQGYRVIYSLITTENEGSLRFHQRLGYREFSRFSDCGLKFGRWLGVVWMEKRSKSVELPTSNPVPWLNVVKNNRNLADILAILSLS